MDIEVIDSVRTLSFALKLRELQECSRRLHGCILGVAAISRQRTVIARELMEATKAAQDCDLALERALRIIGQ